MGVAEDSNGSFVFFDRETFHVAAIEFERGVVVAERRGA